MPPDIASAIGNLHVKLTDSAPAPFQEAAVSALRSDVSFYRQLREEYQERRDLVCDALEGAGFEVGTRPKGGFFVFARIPERYRQGSDDVRPRLFVLLHCRCCFFWIIVPMWWSRFESRSL